MDAARWERIQSVFYGAVDVPESTRPDWLDSACGEDRLLRTEVLAMIEADTSKASLLDRGLPDAAYQIIGSAFDPACAREVGPYRLRRILGEGGMGVVWLAERSDTGNSVAIKFLLHGGLSPARQERFAREIRTLASLKHPFIARLYDAGTLPDMTPWFAMEYVEGLRFTDYCRGKAGSLEGRLRLFRSVCEAVQYAHEHQIIHRDLKPSNVLVEADGTPKLLDFGIAKELREVDEPADTTKLGLRFLSSGYAAPEWECDGVAGTTADVFSLGVILSEVLEQRLPAGKAGGKSEQNELDLLCLKARHPDAAQRYRSVEALIRDIDHYLKNEPLEAKPDTRHYRLSKFIRRHRTAVVAVSLTFALVACLTVLFTLRLAKERNTAMAATVRTERIQSFMLDLFRGDDKEAGPAGDLRVVTLIDRGVQEAPRLSREPDAQAELYQTLGTMYQKLGRLDRAEALLQSSLKEHKALADNAGVAENLIALGLLRSDQGRTKEAERLVREALAAIAGHEPHNKALLMKASFALGEVLVESAKSQEAVEILNSVVAFQSANGPMSPELARTLRVLADAHLSLGHYNVSYSLARRALAIDQRIFGGGHPQAGDDLLELLQIAELWGHYAEAERDARQALSISDAWYGKDHPDTAGKMAHLAEILVMEAHYREADELLERALAIQRRVFGDAHPKVAYVLNAMAISANQQKNFKDAETYNRRVAEIYRSAYGDADYRVAVALGNLASVYFAEKRYAPAERILRDVVQRFTKSLSAGNINTGEAEIRLGRTLLREGRYRDAEEQTRAGYEALEKQTSPSTSFVQGARQDLALIYEALGRPEEARRFRTMENAGR